MRVGEVLTRDVRVANADDTIQQAAHIMAEIDAGVVPVGDVDRSVGMLTGRDIAVRAVDASQDHLSVASPAGLRLHSFRAWSRRTAQLTRSAPGLIFTFRFKV